MCQPAADRSSPCPGVSALRRGGADPTTPAQTECPGLVYRGISGGGRAFYGVLSTGVEGFGGGRVGVGHRQRVMGRRKRSPSPAQRRNPSLGAVELVEHVQTAVPGFGATLCYSVTAGPPVSVA